MTGETEQEKIRHNIAAYKAAIEAGTHSQQELDDYLSEVHEARTGKPFVQPQEDTGETLGDRAAGIISSGYQGLTLGAGNKITAGIRTLLPEAAGGVKGFGREPFRTALREQTDVLDQYRSRHPVEAAVTEFAGGLPTIAASGGLGAAGRGSRLARIGVGAARGAGLGAVTGGAEAVRPDADLRDVGAGAVKGGVIGGALGGSLSTLGVARDVAKGLPSGAVKEIASAAAPRNVMRVIRVGRALKNAGAKAPTAEAAVPQAEGFIGNTMDNLADAKKANVLELVKRQQGPQQALYDALSGEAQAADEAIAKPWKPRGRTKAQFEYFAEQFAKHHPKP